MAKAYKKQSLGRGLSSILEDPNTDINSIKDTNADKLIGNIIDLPVDQIQVNPFQPRSNFEEESIQELAESINELGIIQPITVRKKGFKSYVLFLVQIENIKYFKIAKDIDKDYYENYLMAKKSGVQFLAYKCKVDPKKIKIDKKIKIIDE